MSARPAEPGMAHAHGHTKKDRPVQLVSWDPHLTRWDPATETRHAALIRVTYQGVTKTHWRVVIDGVSTLLPRDTWELCEA